MKRLLRIVTLGMVMIAIALALAVAGCGRKDDPSPLPGRAGVTMGELEAAVTEQGVRLRWSIQGSDTDLALFKIFRGEAETCPGCPRDARLWVQLPLSDSRLERVGKAGFQYVDRDAAKGGSYGYQVVGCDRAGRCSAPSREALAPLGRP